MKQTYHQYIFCFAIALIGVKSAAQPACPWTKNTDSIMAKTSHLNLSSPDFTANTAVVFPNPAKPGHLHHQKPKELSNPSRNNLAKVALS